MTTFEKLCRIITDEFNLDDTELTMETTFSELGLDSLHLVDAVMRIEEEFGVEISDEEMEKFLTLLLPFVPNAQLRGV